MDALHALRAAHRDHPCLTQDVHARPQVAPLQLAGGPACIGLSRLCLRTREQLLVACVQVFMHSAMMEWHTDRQTQVPRNILELCMKSAHVRQPGFVRAYAQFLAHTGDVSNARAVFERALAQPEVPLGIWDAYLEVCCPAVPTCCSVLHVVMSWSLYAACGQSTLCSSCSCLLVLSVAQITAHKWPARPALIHVLVQP